VSFFRVLLNEEIGDVFGLEACISAELFQGDKFAFILPEFFADACEQLTGGAIPSACDVHDIFGIDDYPVGYGIHWYGFISITTFEGYSKSNRSLGKHFLNSV
jgi:hypothetical protein